MIQRRLLLGRRTVLLSETPSLNMVDALPIRTTMLALIRARCEGDISPNPNSDMKAGRANVVPMNAESYPIMHEANDATAADV